MALLEQESHRGWTGWRCLFCELGVDSGKPGKWSIYLSDFVNKYAGPVNGKQTGCESVDLALKLLRLKVFCCFHTEHC